MFIILSEPKVYQSVLDTKKVSQKPGHVTDIYDGQLYKVLDDDGSLPSRLRISAILNTDGISVFKSTNYSLWPVLLMVNELPFTVRCVSNLSVF
jgi:hypothetical protein